MNQSEYESYFDDIYLSSIKRKPPILNSVLLSFYGVFVCLWQKIVKEHASWTDWRLKMSNYFLLLK